MENIKTKVRICVLKRCNSKERMESTKWEKIFCNIHTQQRDIQRMYPRLHRGRGGERERKRKRERLILNVKK